MAFTTRTLVGTLTKGNGTSPAIGAISFVPNARLVDASNDTIIPATPVTKALDANGAFSVALICTDNAGINPVGWAWTVVERVVGAPLKIYDIPLVAGAGSINLADITPYEPAPAVVTYILANTLTTKGDLLGRSSTALGRLGVGTDGQVLTADSAQALGLKWAAGGGGGGGTPGDTVTAETSYGVSSAAGAATEYSRRDHTHGTPSLGTSGTTAAAGNDARFGNLGYYPASGYGFVALAGDPMFYQSAGSFGSNTILFCRVFVPANRTITGAYFAVRTGSAHDGVSFGNKVSVFDDAGSNPISSAVDETMWTAGGWRGAALLSTIAAQAADRYVYALALVRGHPGGVGFCNPSSATDSNAVFTSIGPSQPKRRGGYQNGQTAMPGSFDPTSIGTSSGFTVCAGLTGA